jgi:hypothetical protein
MDASSRNRARFVHARGKRPELACKARELDESRLGNKSRQPGSGPPVEIREVYARRAFEMGIACGKSKEQQT